MPVPSTDTVNKFWLNPPWYQKDGSVPLGGRATRCAGYVGDKEVSDTSKLLIPANELSPFQTTEHDEVAPSAGIDQTSIERILTAIKILVAVELLLVTTHPAAVSKFWLVIVAPADESLLNLNLCVNDK
jgi:hypothetical protein